MDRGHQSYVREVEPACQQEDDEDGEQGSLQEPPQGRDEEERRPRRHGVEGRFGRARHVHQALGARLRYCRVPLCCVALTVMCPNESWASSVGRRRNMQANRSRDTGPELAVRSLLHARGLRYRVHSAPLTGVRRRADIVFTRLKLAVFIDGCFWHACPMHSRPVAVNSDYWSPKLVRNQERDRETDALLVRHGWTPLRFWEHEEPSIVCDQIVLLVAELKGQA